MNERKSDKYYEEIGRHETLNEAQEKALAERIAKGDAQAMNQLVEANLRFVVKIAHEYTGQGLEMGDLVSEGNIGLMEAAQGFLPGKARFVSYAVPIIRRSIEHAIAQQTDCYTLPTHRASEGTIRRKPMSVNAPLPEGSSNTVSLLHVLEDANAVKADALVNEDFDREQLQGLFYLLNERERLVVSGLYGIGTDHRTMAEIAAENGMKRERVRQIRNTALRKMRRKTR